MPIHSAWYLEVAKNILWIGWKNDWKNKFYPGFSTLSTSAQSYIFDDNITKGYVFAFNEMNWLGMVYLKKKAKKSLFFSTLFV